jgi:glutathione S-transferase
VATVRRGGVVRTLYLCPKLSAMSKLPILVGQYDSPFVRRVAVTLHHYGVAFERHIISTFADFDTMLELGPLGKVPVFVLSDGERLWDSRAIIDFLHGQASTERLLLPLREPARRHVLRLEAASLGVAEKTYERLIELARRAPGTQDPAWMARLERQIASALGWLETQRPDPFFAGQQFSVADVTAAVAFTYLRQKLSQLVPTGRFPALESHCGACEAMPAFQAAPYSPTEAARSGWRAETVSGG